MYTTQMRARDMLDIDIYYWMKGVRFKQIRGSLIEKLLSLMDGKYQEERWIYETDTGKATSFHNELRPSIELFESLSMFDRIKEDSMRYGDIGWSLKTKDEVEALYKVARPLSHLVQNCYYNKEYLSSQALLELRELSLKALVAFIRNEKENTEFCKFIAGLIIKWRCPNMKTQGRDAYDVILEYVLICAKNNKKYYEAQNKG